MARNSLLCADVQSRNYSLTHSLDIRPLNPKTVSLLGYPKLIPYTKFEHFGIILF